MLTHTPTTVARIGRPFIYRKQTSKSSIVLETDLFEPVEEVELKFDPVGELYLCARGLLLDFHYRYIGIVFLDIVADCLVDQFRGDFARLAVHRRPLPFVVELNLCAVDKADIIISFSEQVLVHLYHANLCPGEILVEHSPGLLGKLGAVDGILVESASCAYRGDDHHEKQYYFLHVILFG